MNLELTRQEAYALIAAISERDYHLRSAGELFGKESIVEEIRNLGNLKDRLFGLTDRDLKNESGNTKKDVR